MKKDLQVTSCTNGERSDSEEFALELRYHELNEEGIATGRCVSMSVPSFEPLKYEDLADHRLRSKISIPLKIASAKITSSNITHISNDERATVEFKLNSNYTSQTIGLVKGGWLPSGLALQPGMVIMPDRCTLKEIRSQFKNGKKNKENSDFIDFLEDSEVSINPALIALEGNIRSLPTPKIIEQQLNQAYEEIRLALPKAKLVPEDKSSLAGIIGANQDTREGMLRKQSFLMNLAPKIHSPVAPKNISSIWIEIIEKAKSHKIPLGSLVVLAALSATAVPNGRSPAKRLLKLKADYTEQDAYNALSDLRSLEFLACAFSLFPDQKLILLTGDRDLALFWTGLQASNFRWEKSGATFDISIIEDLIPDRTTELKELIQSCPTRKFYKNRITLAIQKPKTLHPTFLSSNFDFQEELE